MMNRLNGWWKSLTLRAKLVGMFLATILFSLVINLNMNQKVSIITSYIGSVYDSSVSISELQVQLDTVHSSLYRYLGGDYDSLNEFYLSEHQLSRMAGSLNAAVSADPILLKEKNIKNTIASYTEKAEHAIAAYRGNNVAQYSQDYEEASRLIVYLGSIIQSLSDELFDQNTRNSRDLVNIQRYAQIVNLMLLVLSTLLELWIIAVATGQLTHPLRLLSDRTRQVGQGHLDLPPLKVYNMDEVGQVTSAFNHMTVQLNDYIIRLQEQLKEENRLKEEQLRLETALKDAQLGALQSQINPHFLYNTLNAGEQLALMEDAERTCLFLECVSDYFRYNLRRSGSDVTLEEELTQAENYLYIMNTRFEGEIHYHEPNLDRIPDIRLPGMILQPLVENAIEHGLRMIDGEKHLYIEVEEEADRVVVIVADNGAGFPPEKAAALLAAEETPPEIATGSHGIGMFNVLSRLRLYYGRNGVMEIGRMPDGMGTEIRLLLPKESAR